MSAFLDTIVGFFDVIATTDLNLCPYCTGLGVTVAVSIIIMASGNLPWESYPVTKEVSLVHQIRNAMRQTTEQHRYTNSATPVPTFTVQPETEYVL